MISSYSGKGFRHEKDQPKEIHIARYKKRLDKENFPYWNMTFFILHVPF